MTLRKVEYLVAELPEHPQQLIITREGMRYESHSNLTRPESLGIGVFERRLERAEMEAIESQLDPVRLRLLPDHYGKVLSGDRSKRIRLTADDGTIIEKLVGTKLPVDPTLQRAIDWLDRLADDVTRYPRQVLLMSLQDVTLGREGEFSATLILSGAGDQPVRFRPPRGQPDAPDGLLTLYWWPYTGGPKSNVQAAPIISQVSTASTPGALATFRIRSRLEGGSAGAMALQVRYLNMASKLDASDVLLGQLFSSPIVVR